MNKTERDWQRDASSQNSNVKWITSTKSIINNYTLFHNCTLFYLSLERNVSIRNPAYLNIALDNVISALKNKLRITSTRATAWSYSHRLKSNLKAVQMFIQTEIKGTASQREMGFNKNL